jgi:hypothetical protein
MIKKKHLMINLIVLHQSYECYKIKKIYWIYRDDNPVDVFIKVILNAVLQIFIDNNYLTIKIEGFVEHLKQAD